MSLLMKTEFSWTLEHRENVSRTADDNNNNNNKKQLKKGLKSTCSPRIPIVFLAEMANQPLRRGWFDLCWIINEQLNAQRAKHLECMC